LHDGFDEALTHHTPQVRLAEGRAKMLLRDEVQVEDVEEAQV